MYRGIDIDLDAIKRNTAVGRGGGDGERAIGGQSRDLELKGRDLREEGERRSGEKWKWRRESEGWPEEVKAESEGEKMVRDDGGVHEEESLLERSWRVSDMERKPELEREWAARRREEVEREEERERRVREIDVIRRSLLLDAIDRWFSYKHFICQPPTQTHSANQVNEPRLNGCAHNNTVTDPLLFLGFSVDKVGKKARALCL
ncbi:hypothetical protein LWI29_011930 [Acer saccharum]|uniref:Uncharacterized protein n=1 Tax=Acer saccharum TaxID=4024 RepID=A0AA39RGN4_ACESA|nr:hypothetical protein LWI29_011930 [Acer saccharum]